MKKVKLETEETIDVNDLTNDMHIGWVDDFGIKVFIVNTGSGKYAPIRAKATDCGNDAWTSDFHGVDVRAIILKLKNRIKDIYTFQSLQELYQWLAS